MTGTAQDRSDQPTASIRGGRRQWRSPAVLVAVAALVVVAAACSGGSGSAGDGTTTTRRAATTTAPVVTTTAPPPRYPGRLLLIDSPADGTSRPTRVRQLTADGFRPSPVASFPAFTGVVQTIAPDHSSLVYQAPDESLHVVGPGVDVALPARVSTGALSPDGTQLAYSSSTDGETALYVHDIAAGTDRAVLKEPCASYSNAPGDGTICGSITGQVWVDRSTLFVVHFAGDMPTQVRCQPGDPVTLCYPIPANQYSLVGTDGRVFASISNENRNAEVPASAHGRTIVLSNGTWIDLDQLRAGSGTIRDLPAAAEVSSLSPDGTKVVVPNAKAWTVADLRTGAVTQLGTPGIAPEAKNWNSENVVWSPDGTWFAVQTQTTGATGDAVVTVVPVSAERGGRAARTGPDATLFAWAD